MKICRVETNDSFVCVENGGKLCPKNLCSVEKLSFSAVQKFLGGKNEQKLKILKNFWTINIPRKGC